MQMQHREYGNMLWRVMINCLHHFARHDFAPIGTQENRSNGR